MTFLRGLEPGGSVEVDAGISPFPFAADPFAVRPGGTRSADAADGGGIRDPFPFGSGRKADGRTEGGGMSDVADLAAAAGLV